MQAVILAAGRGTRMGALTDSTPKPMLQVAGKTLLEHKFDALPADVDEIIMVVGHMGGVIQSHFGGSYGNKRILYVEQENPQGGTAEALWLARDFLHDKFFVMNGDNIYGAEDMAECAKYEWAVLVQKKQHMGRAANVVIDNQSRIVAVVENITDSKSPGLTNTALYVLDMRIFDYPAIPKAEGSTELGLPQTMMQAAKDVPIQAVEASLWIEIKEPDDLQKAEDILGGQ
ncbi:MAG: nucleotidyltransferase family protein [Patescibacteria group bacterium]